MPSPQGTQRSGRVTRESPAGSGAGLLTQKCEGKGRFATKVEVSRRETVEKEGTWTGGGSNPGPLPCEGSALPAELPAPEGPQSTRAPHAPRHPCPTPTPDLA